MTTAISARALAVVAARATRTARGARGQAAARRCATDRRGGATARDRRATFGTRMMSRGATPRAVTTEDEVEAETRREARESAVGAAPPHEVSEEKEYDVFRDSLLRYMGYANECGEAFVAWLPVWGVPATYGIAATYVLADTVDKGVKRWNKAEGASDRANQAAAVATETLTWQMLASVFWPGSFIRVVVATTNLALAKADVSAFDSLAAQGLDVERILPTLLGLAAIPFIVKPIDTTIDAAAEISFAKALRGEMKNASEWAVGAGVVGACLAVPPVLFGLAETISNAAQ
jgi:fission process protein 1